MLSTVLFVVVFGSVLGRHVDTSGGVPYGQFIVGGLFAQAILNVGFFNGTTSGDVSAVSALAVLWALALALSVWSAVIFGTKRLKA